MPSFAQQYATLAILTVAGTLLYTAILLINRVMSPSYPHPGKLTTYECGVDAVGTDWSQMNIRYYVFAFLFVIFDVESIFLFPWAVILGDAPGIGPSSLFVLMEMLLFIAVLAVGLVYAWRKKVLVWE